MRVLSFFSLLIFIFLTAPLSGQNDGEKLSLEAIFKNNSYPTRYYRSVRWLDDSKSTPPWNTMRSSDAARSSTTGLKAEKGRYWWDQKNWYPRGQTHPCSLVIIPGLPICRNSCYSLTRKGYGGTIHGAITG